MAKKPNLLFFGLDSQISTHMSLYGYKHLTTPFMSKFAESGVVFENNFSPSVPTTPGYASMLTGMDTFGTDVVALRHKGELGPWVTTMSEVLDKEGYNTTCIGFTGNPSARGFQKYLDYSGWGPDESGRSPKAESMNKVAIPELKRLAGEDKPFFLFLRHMDPHSPYLPPLPFERIFYDRDEFDPNNKSMEPVYNFKPFCDYFVSWIPEGTTDKDYVIAQYDGAVAYMDACIQNIFTTLADLGIEEETLVVITSDHGETLYDHDCYFDHHGIYDNTLRVPLVFRYPGKVPAGKRIENYTQLKDVMPTVLSLMGIATDINFDGRDLVPEINGDYCPSRLEPEFYISECTWMRKHGWRTPEWKFIWAQEPDFHFKPEFELYNLVNDPEEYCNLATEQPELVEYFKKKVLDHVAKREKVTGREAPIKTNLDWHGAGCGPFTSSEQAYNTMHIGNVGAAQRLQAKLKEDK